MGTKQLKTRSEKSKIKQQYLLLLQHNKKRRRKLSIIYQAHFNCDHKIRLLVQQDKTRPTEKAPQKPLFSVWFGKRQNFPSSATTLNCNNVLMATISHRAEHILCWGLGHFV